MEDEPMNASRKGNQPPEITSLDPGSFGYGVITRRHPSIIEAVRGQVPYPLETQRRLDDMITEAAGSVPPVPDDAADAELWKAWARPYVGQDWLTVPFLWAESYFYKLLLEATGYFTSGPWGGVDPFKPQKDAELESPELAGDLASLDGLLSAPVDESLNAALCASLWGNRADLGFRLSDPASTSRDHTDELVVDDAPSVWKHLASRPGSVVHLIADNAGRELVADLVLVDRLLESQQATSVVLHLKPHPYFVSDATTHDLLTVLAHLAHSATAASEVAQRVSTALGNGRIEVRAHRFWCDPLTFHALPADLRADLGAADLVIIKGDLNYRRLVGDRRWAPQTPFEAVARHFPAPLLALRTLKSELAVGVSSARLEEMEAITPSWRTDGTHAVIQACLRRP